MSRAILTLPAGRDPRAEARLAGISVTALRPVPDAVDGGLQAWDTNEREALAQFYADDPAVTLYQSYAAVPWAIRRFLFTVRRSDTPFTFGSGAGGTNVHWLRLHEAVRGVVLVNGAEVARPSFTRARRRSTTQPQVARGDAVTPGTHWLVDTRPLHVWAGAALAPQAGTDGATDVEMGEDA